MKTAVLLAFFTAVASQSIRAELGETREEIQARYKSSSASVRPETVLPWDKPMEFRQRSRVVLVWFHDGRSIAEMFLCPHGLRHQQVQQLLAAQAASSNWVSVPCKEKKAHLWTRKDQRAITWVTDSDSEFAVFAAVDTGQLEKLGRMKSFQAIAVKYPMLWANVIDLAATHRVAAK